MDGPLSVTSRDIHMIDAGNEVVAPLKIKFYKGYVDDKFNWQKKNFQEFLFKRLSNYYWNIELTIQINLTKCK